MRDVGDRLIEALLEGGINALFGVPGGQTLPLYAAARRRGLNHVMMRDERAAACAADAWARSTGRVGVCDATVGPGVTNLISGLAEAHASSVPVLAIIADVPRHWNHLRRSGVAAQALDQRLVLEGVCKWIGRVEEPGSCEKVLEHALRVATTGRPGPVVLELPDDILSNEFPDSEQGFPPEVWKYPRFRSALTESDVCAVTELLSKAERPLILAGGGVHLAAAAERIERLALDMHIPVVTSPNGKGAIDEENPLALGVTGIFGNVLASRALAQADIVVAFGTKFAQLSTFTWRLPGEKQTVIQIDIDAEELGRSVDIARGCVADAREAAGQLSAALAERGLSKFRDWSSSVSDEGQPGTAAEDPAIAPEAVVKSISARLTDSDVLLCDASLPSGWGAQYFKVKSARRGFLAPRGLAGIGWSCGAAVGAQAALGATGRVVCLAGDGGFAYSMAEIETAVRMSLPIVYVVLNNASYGWIRHTEQFRKMEPVSDLGLVNFALISKALGGEGRVVTDFGEFDAVLEEALAGRVPFLIDVRSSCDASPTLGLRNAIGERPLQPLPG